MPIQRRFDEDLAELKQKILRMGSLVENQIRQALKALVDRLKVRAKGGVA